MSKKLKVHLALFMVALIYAATFTIAKEVMPAYVKPYAFILLRISVATVCIFIFHRLYVNEGFNLKRDFWPLFVSAVFGVAANMLLFFKGLSITTPINGAVLMLNTPIFVIVFAWLLLNEKLTFKKISGIIIAATGAVLLVGGTNLTFNSNTALGDLYVTLNAIIYAFYLVYAKRLMHKYHPLTVTLYSFFIGFFLVLPFGFEQATEIQFTKLPAGIWLGIAFVTVGSTFITYVLNAYALKHASSSLVGSYIYLQPVLATIIAVLAGKDTLTLEKIGFALLVFTGVMLAALKKQ
jgi:drug/metabolite transporter (DMT)-like permease